MKRNKKQLYESIMKDVSKIVKKHLNENIDTNWDNSYKQRIILWINNMIHNPEFIEEFVNITKSNMNLGIIGYLLGKALLNVVESGNLIIPESMYETWEEYLITSIIKGLDYSVNNKFTEYCVKLIKTPDKLSEVIDDFIATISDEGMHFLFVNDEYEAYEFAEDADYYYVLMLNEDGEWEEVYVE